ncbi:MAG: 1-deoxy-D-xylulose-5-phosphate reductoisomerase [Planctomycetes bacterium]|nr:1-deoxy-D-xylulose-5-phosphate reductoisomerase [Planctomycetota bacterium]
MSSAGKPRRRLILLGSTGSIGTNTLAVVEHLHAKELAQFDVVGLATGSNAEVLHEQALQFGVKHVAIVDPAHASLLSDLPNVFTGADAALELIEAIARKGDLVVGAMVGAAGVPATLAAIDRGCDIALANKETLVAAGEIVIPKVKKKGIQLLPIDSEHSALFQCLQAGRSIDEVKQLVLTASGGPFRNWEKDRLYNATVKETLNHPTWDMGPKVTVDSASLMNKALEVIEAHWLFGMPAEKIKVVVHPQSIIHSFVEFVDGSVVGQLSPPDMKMPIQFAITWPDRVDGASKAMDWSSLHQLEFGPVDHERFPALGLAYDVIKMGGTAGATFNAANEAAVSAFLDGRIPFGMITQLVGEVLNQSQPTPVTCLDDVLNADEIARQMVAEKLNRESSVGSTEQSVGISPTTG